MQSIPRCPSLTDPEIQRAADALIAYRYAGGPSWADVEAILDALTPDQQWSAHEWARATRGGS